MPESAKDWSALLRAANDGDAQAYTDFLRAVTPALRSLVRARGTALASDTQEDIVQEVLIAIHRKRHTWQMERPVRPWLYAIARHKVIDAFRARGQRVHLPITDFEELLEAEPATDSLARHDLGRLMARLDRRSADIVRAISLNDETAGEVGARLGMSDGAVRIALHRALKRLAQLAGRTRE